LTKTPIKSGNENQHSADVAGKVAQVQIALSELKTNLQRVRDTQEKAAPLRVQFAERLLLLDGGTFTVTLTAIGIIAPHVSPAQVTHVFLLFGAWWLLLASMALSIFSLWLDTIIPVVRSKNLAMTDLGKSLKELENAAQSLESAGFKNVQFPEFPDQSEKMNLMHRVENPLIVRLGIALVLTFVAFVSFLLFVQSNAHALFTGVK
jgi:hypothetical protein